MKPSKFNLMKRRLLAAALVMALPLSSVSVAAAADDAAVPPASLHERHAPHDLETLGALGQDGSNSLLKLLKLDEATLRSRLNAGESLADIAKSQGVEKQKVIDLLVKMQKERVAEAVKSGRITADQAKQINERIVEHTTRIVESNGGAWHGRGHQHHSKRLDETAQVLGMSSDSLLQELKNGKTIAQIAKEKGISEDALVTKLLDKERARIKERIHRVWGKANQTKSEQK
ncbi:hypothetical protein [Cohnella sp. AR92]|uniref:hypothetical protein n=1 Tax=Cohnella sp. AR92 TaxID=648716 RepID=UPI000F8DA66A|nr:hypothetical protein [Cohnella sp. AR92]RUS48372.1 hypothetical protein ELR57_02830 [Cohnella sp. AR92]